jgi:hypothetical protein
MTDSTATATTRRTFSAAVLAAAFAGGMTRVAAAQDATPAAGEGSGKETAGYVAVRHWKLTEGTDYAEFTRKVAEGYVPIIQAVEGFVDYYFANPGNGEHVAIAIFTSKAGAEASTEAAKDWSTTNLQGIVDGPPLSVIEAEIWLTATPLGVESRV